jgi:serine-type D-Ala-D-Ala carboxypeptidase/endopeptidase (penicillin-binding protein 4)
VVRALAAAPALASDAVVGAIARGLARSKEPDHPLAETVRQAAKSDGAELAAYAHRLGPQLEEQLAAARAVLQAAPATIGPPGRASERPEPQVAKKSDS